MIMIRSISEKKQFSNSGIINFPKLDWFFTQLFNLSNVNLVFEHQKSPVNYHNFPVFIQCTEYSFMVTHNQYTFICSYGFVAVDMW